MEKGRNRDKERERGTSRRDRDRRKREPSSSPSSSSSSSSSTRSSSSSSSKGSSSRSSSRRDKDKRSSSYASSYSKRRSHRDKRRNSRDRDRKSRRGKDNGKSSSSRDDRRRRSSSSDSSSKKSKRSGSNNGRHKANAKGRNDFSKEFNSQAMIARIEEKLDIGSQINRLNAIEDLERDSFAPKSFKSSATTTTKKVPLKLEDIPMPSLELKPINLNNLGKEILCHPSLIISQKERDEQWVKKLWSLGQKLNSGVGAYSNMDIT